MIVIDVAKHYLWPPPPVMPGKGRADAVLGIPGDPTAGLAKAVLAAGGTALARLSPTRRFFNSYWSRFIRVLLHVSAGVWDSCIRYATAFPAESNPRAIPTSTPALALHQIRVDFLSGFPIGIEGQSFLRKGGSMRSIPSAVAPPMEDQGMKNAPRRGRSGTWRSICHITSEVPGCRLISS